MRAASIAPGRRPNGSRRRCTLYDLHGIDAEIPYVKTERAIRDLVCSLMERQDRMNEEIFLRINDLQYRLDDIDEKMAMIRARRNAAIKGATG